MTPAAAHPANARRPAAATAPGLQAAADAGARRRRWFIALFLVAFALPWEPIVAGLLISPVRLYMLFAFLPLLVALLAGRGGGVTAADGLLFGFGLWMAMTFVMHHGAERIPYTAITFVELLGGYLAGRILIRNAGDYRFFFSAFSVMLLCLLPFALIEMLTGRALLSEILGQVMRVTPRSTEVRNSYWRAGVSYPHPIHWGLISAMLLAQAWYLWRDRLLARWMRVGVAVACTVTAMSSAPLLGLAVQGLLILWGRVTGNRWWLFAILFSVGYVTIDLLSNRGPVIILIETLTLNPQTAWWRVHIWNHGTASVMNHPLFGIGLNDWRRPEWLAPTVDNFWLLMAMRHGLPAILMLVLGLALHVFALVRARGLAPGDANIRTAWMIGFAALCFMLATVHAWGSPSVFVMFYFGMASFLYTGGATPAGTAAADAAPQPAPAAARAVRYSRFPLPSAGAPAGGRGPAPAGRAAADRTARGRR